MKRSGFKRKYVGEFKGYKLLTSRNIKPRKPLKRTKLKKKSKQKISLLQRKLWEQCKRIIRERYKNCCYTCQKSDLEGTNWHTGHLWAKASLGAYLKYDLRILRPQCYHCNINLGGAGADFYLKMWEENGAKYMNQLKEDRKVEVRAYEHYEKLLAEYSQM